jgi:hypothetical protein
MCLWPSVVATTGQKTKETCRNMWFTFVVVVGFLCVVSHLHIWTKHLFEVCGKGNSLLLAGIQCYLQNLGRCLLQRGTNSVRDSFVFITFALDCYSLIARTLRKVLLFLYATSHPLQDLRKIRFGLLKGIEFL